MGRLQHDFELMKANVQAVKDDMKTMEGTLQMLRDDIVRVAKDLSTVDSRTIDLTLTMKDVRLSLEECKHANMQTAEDHEITKTHVGDLQSNAQKLSTQARQLQDGLNRTTTGLQKTQGQVTTALNEVEATRDNLEQTNGDLHTLRCNHDDLSSKHKSVARATEDLSRSMNETRKGLRDTNNLVLPNLQMGSTSLMSTQASLTDPRSPRGVQSPFMTPKSRKGPRPLDI